MEPHAQGSLDMTVIKRFWYARTGSQVLDVGETSISRSSSSESSVVLL